MKGLLVLAILIAVTGCSKDAFADRQIGGAHSCIYVTWYGDVIVKEPPGGFLPPLDGPPGVLTVYAYELFQLYQSNAVAADTGFLRKTFAVRGSVQRVGVDLQGEPYVVLCGGSLFGVQCFFDPKNEEQIREISSLRPKDWVVITGVGRGYFYHAIISDCSVYCTRPYEP